MRGTKPVAEPVTQVVSRPLGTRLPAPPGTLPEGLPRECWAEVVRELVTRGIWDSDISDMVEAYCVQRARFITANAQVEETGQVVHVKRYKSGGKTYGAKPQTITIIKPNPYVALSNAAHDRMVRLAQELGLTAVRRGSVQRSTIGAKIAGAEKFLKSTKPAKVKEPA